MKTIMIAALAICLTGCVSLGPSSGKAPSQLAAERQARVEQARAEHPNAWNPSPAMLAALGEQRDEDWKTNYDILNPLPTVSGPY